EFPTTMSRSRSMVSSARHPALGIGPHVNELCPLPINRLRNEYAVRLTLTHQAGREIFRDDEENQEFFGRGQRWVGDRRPNGWYFCIWSCNLPAKFMNS